MFQIPKSYKLRNPKWLMNPKHKKNEKTTPEHIVVVNFCVPRLGHGVFRYLIKHILGVSVRVFLDDINI